MYQTPRAKVSTGVPTLKFIFQPFNLLSNYDCSLGLILKRRPSDLFLLTPTYFTAIHVQLPGLLPTRIRSSDSINSTLRITSFSAR